MQEYVTASIRYSWVHYGRTPCAGDQPTATPQHAWYVVNTEVKHTAIRQLEFEHTTSRVRGTDETIFRDPALWFYGIRAWLNVKRTSPTLHQRLRYQSRVPNYIRLRQTSHRSRQSTGITGLIQIISYKPPELMGRPTYENENNITFWNTGTALGQYKIKHEILLKTA